MQGKYYKYTPDVRCRLYCLLLVDGYTLNIGEDSYKNMLNKLRDRYFKEEEISNEISYAYFPEEIMHIKDNTITFKSDDIRHDVMYAFVTECLIVDSDLVFFLNIASGHVITEYCRSWEYKRNEGERCLYIPDEPDMLSPVIERLQLDIIKYCSISDREIHQRITHRLNVSNQILMESEGSRKKFLTKLRREGESVHHKRRSHDSVDHVKWFWRNDLDARPDIVRSCIGLHPHLDIYITDNKAFRKPSTFYNNKADVRSLLYCLLLLDGYTLNILEDSHKTKLNELRERYFKDEVTKEISTERLPKEIVQIEDNMITFTSDDTRHDVMYAFVTECLVEESDLEFFLTTASRDVISEYCRPWDHKRGGKERCLYIPEKIENLFLKKLRLDIIVNCSILDWKICDKVITTCTFYNNKADVRSLLYCLLLLDGYTLNILEDSHKTKLNELRERYFKDEVTKEISTERLPKEIVQIEDNMITFTSDDTRHDVMYAFVTECLVEESDLEFFLTTASRDVISEYCRPWDHKRGGKERCLYIPEKIENLFLKKLRLDIIVNCSILDWKICDKVITTLGVPREVLQWDQEARERYVECAKRGTQTVHHARGMIVGCAGAGKTTLLKRLLGCSEEEIEEVKSTEGLEVHEEIFQICDETKRLKAKKVNFHEEDEKGSFDWNKNAKTLTFFDFGGQCAYYACHQIYLTRRAFYVVVVDASKELDQKVDKNVCDQDGSIFSGWTYGDYFVFWMKSIRTYCMADNRYDTDILIAATHWGNKKYSTEEEFIICLQRSLPGNSDLRQFVRRNNCFFTSSPLQPVVQLEKRIVDIASQTRWTEKIPKEWAHFEIEINQKKSSQKILERKKIISLPEKETEDMLRFYHDSGKVLYFKERDLKESVILDVQWFIDTFKKIIIDKLHLEDIAGSMDDWDEYYETGMLRWSLLINIWTFADKLSNEKFIKEGSTNKNHSEEDFRNDPRYILFHEHILLQFMQRLGLMAICNREKSIYVPCMNRRELEESQSIVEKYESKSSILIFKFDFLPYFLFFRLVVACMQQGNWKALKSGQTFCLYKNIALFSSHDQEFAIAVTASSIQLQVYQSEEGKSIDDSKSRKIQEKLEQIMQELIGTFQIKMMFKRGLSCKENTEQFLTMDIEGHFLEEEMIPDGDRKVCPLHQGTDRHLVNANRMTRFWKMKISDN